MIWEYKDWLVAAVAVGAPSWAFYALIKGSIVVPGRHRGNPGIKRYRRDSDAFIYWLNIFLLLLFGAGSVYWVVCKLIGLPGPF